MKVKEGAGVCGRLRGGLGDGQQVRAVASQDGRHEAQEGLLDLQLQSVEAFPPVELAVSHGVLHLHVVAIRLTTLDELLVDLIQSVQEIFTSPPGQEFPC